MNYVKNAHRLFQYSGVEAFNLLAYDGSLSVAELNKYGNFGLGCFNALNGELIVFDNQYFHATADGQLNPALPSALVSCVYMMHFQPQYTLRIEKPFQLKDLQNLVKPILSHKGQPFYAISIIGSFEQINLRSVPPQKTPYPPIDDVVKNQALFEYHDIEGRMVGFHFPLYLNGLTFPDFHFHFANKNLSQGGHILDFQGTSAVIQIDPIHSYYYQLPDYVKNREPSLIKKKTGSF